MGPERWTWRRSAGVNRPSRPRDFQTWAAMLRLTRNNFWRPSQGFPFLVTVSDTPQHQGQGTLSWPVPTPTLASVECSSHNTTAAPTAPEHGGISASTCQPAGLRKSRQPAPERYAARQSACRWRLIESCRALPYSWDWGLWIVRLRAYAPCARGCPSPHWNQIGDAARCAAD